MANSSSNKSYLSQSDLFLLERWQEDSPLSIEAQRHQIFSEWIQLGVRGREPYRAQKAQSSMSYVDELPAHSQNLLNRVRRPDLKRDSAGYAYALRTCYGKHSGPAWDELYDEEITRVLEDEEIFNDESLFNFGPNWERMFLLKPELLEITRTADKYEEDVRLSLEESIEYEEDLQDPLESSDDHDDRSISFCYHRAITLNRIHIVDATTLASEGPDAGKVLIVFFDESGRTVRYFRDEGDEAVEHAALSNAYLDDHACWANADIGELYQRGQPLGPPYRKVLEQCMKC